MKLLSFIFVFVFSFVPNLLIAQVSQPKAVRLDLSNWIADYQSHSIRTCLFYSLSNAEQVLACKLFNQHGRDSDILMLHLNPNGSVRDSQVIDPYTIDTPISYRGLLGALSHQGIEGDRTGQMVEKFRDGVNTSDGLNVVLTIFDPLDNDLIPTNPHSSDSPPAENNSQALQDIFGISAIDAESRVIWHYQEDLLERLWPKLDPKASNPQDAFHLLKWLQPRPQGGVVVYGQARWSPAFDQIVPNIQDETGSFFFCFDDQGKYIDGLLFPSIFVQKQNLSLDPKGGLHLLYPFNYVNNNPKAGEQFTLANMSADCHYQDIAQYDLSPPNHFLNKSQDPLQKQLLGIHNELLGSLTSGDNHHFILYLQKPAASFAWQNDPSPPSYEQLRELYMRTAPGLFVLETDELGNILADYPIISPDQPDRALLLTFNPETNGWEIIHHYSLGFSADGKSILLAFYNPIPASMWEQKQESTPAPTLVLYQLPLHHCSFRGVSC